TLPPNTMYSKVVHPAISKGRAFGLMVYRCNGLNNLLVRFVLNTLPWMCLIVYRRVDYEIESWLYTYRTYDSCGYCWNSCRCFNSSVSALRGSLSSFSCNGRDSCFKIYYGKLFCSSSLQYWCGRV